jgi:hypothetical protein
VAKWCGDAHFAVERDRIFVQSWVACRGCVTCNHEACSGNGVGEEMEDVIKKAPRWQVPTWAIRDVLQIAGFPVGEARCVDVPFFEGDFVCTLEAYDGDGPWSDGRRRDYDTEGYYPQYLAMQGEDGVWQIATGGVDIDVQYPAPWSALATRREEEFELLSRILREMGRKGELARIVDALFSRWVHARVEYGAVVREWLGQLMGEEVFSYLSPELKEQMREMQEGIDTSGENVYVPMDLDNPSAWLAPAWEQAQQLKEREDAGEIRVNFGGGYRTIGKTEHAQYRVVFPDGMLRVPDLCWMRRGGWSSGEKNLPNGQTHGEGAAYWRVVGERGEIALAYSRQSAGGAGECRVVHMPEVVTGMQRQAVRDFEASLGVPEGSFGLDAELCATHEAVVSAVNGMIDRLNKVLWKGVIHEDDVLVYGTLFSRDGYCFASGDMVLPIRRSGAADARCCSRDAWTVHREVIRAGGEEWEARVVWVYWGGEDNLSVFLHPLSEEQRAEKEVASGLIGEAASKDALFELLDKFGGGGAGAQKNRRR